MDTHLLMILHHMMKYFTMMTVSVLYSGKSEKVSGYVSENYNLLFCVTQFFPEFSTLHTHLGFIEKPQALQDLYH